MIDEYECTCGHWESFHCSNVEDCEGCSDCSCNKSREDVISDSSSTYHPHDEPRRLGKEFTYNG